MGRYRSYTQQKPKERPWDVHPIWRGIGCILIILIPIMAYAGAVLLVRENIINKWILLPPELADSFVIPYINTQVYFADIAATFILMFVGFGIFVIIYSFLYSLLGPPRYGPLDAPPVKRQSKRRK
jgi:hypothetical protein